MPASASMPSDLEFALRLADAADPLTLAGFRSRDLLVETKPDLTPVTDVDRAVETRLRELVARERPGEDVLGEEYGGGNASTRWIVDPIDGTKNYVRGIPVFATLIALERDGALTVGVVSAPGLSRRWWAARGLGAHADGRPIQTSRVSRWEDAQVLHASLDTLRAAGRLEQFVDLSLACWRTRGFGDFWMHMLVAEGAAEVAIDPVVSLWDVAAVRVIVEEAGGAFTDLGGAASANGGSAVSTNRLLHPEALRRLAPR